MGVLLFGFAAGFENPIQAAGGSLVDTGWTASKHLFSAQQKMQTNPCCSVHLRAAIFIGFAAEFERTA